MAITKGGRVAMKATSKAAKRNAQKMPALEKALTPAQKANKARKVEARKASKARRKANQEAWELKNLRRESYDLPKDFWDTKHARLIRKKHEASPTILSKEQFDLLRPLYNRQGRKGLAKAFSPEDREILRSIGWHNQNKIRAFKNDPYRSFRGDNVLDADVKQFSQIKPAIEDLKDFGGDDAVRMFRQMLPDWPGSISELVALIRNTI